MGQIVQYGNMGTRGKQRTLKWIDQSANDGVVTGKPVPNTTQKLAKLIPIQDTFQFSADVTQFKIKMARDVTSCLRVRHKNKLSASMKPTTASLAESKPSGSNVDRSSIENLNQNKKEKDEKEKGKKAENKDSRENNGQSQ